MHPTPAHPDPPYATGETAGAEAVGPVAPRRVPAREAALVGLAVFTAALGAGLIFEWFYEPGRRGVWPLVAGAAPALLAAGLSGLSLWLARRRADREAQRRAQADRLSRVLLDGLRGHAVYMLDRSGRIATWGPGARDLFGYEAPEVLGRHVGVLHPGGGAEAAPGSGQPGIDAVGDAMRVALERGRFEDDAPRVRKDGSTFRASVVLTPVRDEAGRHVGFAKVVRDVTERHEVQARLERYTEELLEAKAALETQAAALEAKSRENLAARAAAEEANRAKSAFIANVSHEIRTPMTAILGFAELLGDPETPAPERDSYARTVRASGEHLLSIINDILDLSKIEANAVEVERLPVSAADLLFECVDLFKPRAQAKGLGLGLEFDGPVPERILTDPTRLRQILANLVGNAIKFTQHGGVRIVAGLDGQSSLFRVRVVDTGIGMDAEAIDKLFRPFVQADSSTSRRFGGTGLGLTISRRFARMLGGDLSAASRLGEGSTFTLTLDPGPLEGVGMLRQPADGAAGLGPPTAPRRAGADPPAPPSADRPTLCGRVLLADDGEDNRRLISLVLSKAGAHVVCVQDGRAAVEAAIAATTPGGRPGFDLVLMDMQMPVMDGLAATASLRSRGYTGRIVALTANAMAADRDRCLTAGCNDFLTKPITRDRLLSAAAQWLAPDRATPTPPAGRPGAAA